MDELLTVRETAQVLGVSLSTVHRLRQAGLLTPVSVPALRSRIFYRASEVRALRVAQEVE